MNFNQEFVTNFIHPNSRLSENLFSMKVLGFPSINLVIEDNEIILPNTDYIVEFMPFFKNNNDKNIYTFDKLNMKLVKYSQDIIKNKKYPEPVPAHFTFYFKEHNFILNPITSVIHNGMRDLFPIFSLTNLILYTKQHTSYLALSFLLYYFELSISSKNIDKYLKMKSNIEYIKNISSGSLNNNSLKESDIADVFTISNY